MMSDPLNYQREHSPYGSCSLSQFEGSDVISVFKNSIEYSFVFFKCLMKTNFLSLGTVIFFHQFLTKYSLNNDTLDLITAT